MSDASNYVCDPPSNATMPDNKSVYVALGGSNTLRRQCVKRVCINKAAGGYADDMEVSAYTQECLEAAIAHGEATASAGKAEAGAPEDLLALGRAPAGTREAPCSTQRGHT